MDKIQLKIWAVVCTVFICQIVDLHALRQCETNDYKFVYTQCDNLNQRWRVSVPNTDDCEVSSSSYSSVPHKAASCVQSCGKGEFLDIVTLACQKCPPGTFSSGSSVRYDDWDALPPGFTSSTEVFQGSIDDGDVNCSRNEWKPRSSYVSSNPGLCAANLIYSTKLVKGGSLQFEYQHSSSNVLFHVLVQNDQCQAASDKEADSWPDTSPEGQWKHFSIKLKTGINVITFRVIGIGEEEDDHSPVLIRKVSITGVAYSSNCSKCEPGTYSSEGAEYCTGCGVNFYNDERGASYCKPCDPKTQYSDEGSTKCKERLACTTNDYYHLMTPCENGKTKMTYQWTTPIICNPEHKDSVKLPTNNAEVECRQCNPGHHHVNGSCVLCPVNQASDGKDCQQCPPSTAPDYGYVFENWNSIPTEIKASCVSFSAQECLNDTKWLPFGDHIHSHFAHEENAYLVLQLKVDGFRTTQKEGDESTSAVGQLKVNFETYCNAYCQFLVLSDESGSEEIVEMFENQQSLTNFKYDIKKNGSFTFTLAFQNSDWIRTPDAVKINGTVKIYNIEVTNTLGGGAKTCQKCPQGHNQDGCIPCPDGYYIDETTVTCVQCPAGTIVSSHNAYGAESCKSCGQGLKVSHGRACYWDGKVEDGSGHVHDLSSLKSFHFVKGSPLFTSSGTQYFHGFNISLFGDPDKSHVMCENNITSSDDKAVKEPRHIMAKICRSTLIPSIANPNEVMATQSTSLGDQLTAVVYNETSIEMKNGTKVSIRNLYNASGFDAADIEYDIQVHFQSDLRTRVCKDGRRTVITLRCDPDQKGDGVISLPPKCSDGTCDGCTFHFMWSTKAACPRCTLDDYNKVVGECVQGYQTVHLFRPKHCLMENDKDKLEEKQKCTMHLTSLPLVFQIAIPTVVGLACIFLCLLCFIWRKNKKLEYRYMKLVEGTGANEGELPAAETCALEEDEFDDQGDSVQIKDSKGARFFKKLTNKIKKDDDAFDTALMNERMPLT